MDILESLEENVIVFAVILVVVGVAGFVGYKKLTQEFGGTGSQTGNTPGGQKNVSIVDSIFNGSLSTGDSSQSYTNAAGEVLIHPIDSIKSILGW